MSEPSDELDLSLEDVFPDASSLLQAHSRSVEEMKEDCLVILDTNVLLVPYLIAPHPLDEVRRAFEQLLENNRLFLPSRVVREFVRNRARKLEDIYQQLTRRRSQQRNFAGGRYVLLEKCEPYGQMLEVEKAINEQLEKHKELAGQVIEHVRSWSWSDPVSELYRELFKDATFIDPEETPEDIKKELRRRHQHQIPPGYKDAAKPDKGVGDLVIWLAILALGRKEKRDVLFVTGEEKADWWHRSEGQVLYPRFELVEEFWRASGGRSFQITKLSTLLSLSGTEPSVVTQVRAGELQTSSEANVYSPINQRRDSRNALRKWMRRELEAVSIVTSKGGDHLIQDVDGDYVTVSPVKLDLDDDPLSAKITIKLAILEQVKSTLAGHATYGVVLLIGSDASHALTIYDWGLALLEGETEGELRMYSGYFDGKDFVEVASTRGPY